MKYLLILLVAFIALTTTAPTQAANAEDFSRLPAYQRVRLSPEGNQLAFIENNTKHEAAILRVLDLNTGKVRSLVNSDNKRVKIKWHRWKSNTLLMVSVRYESKREDGFRFYQSKLYSIDTKAKEIKKVEMFRPHTAKHSPFYSPGFYDDVVSWLPEDPKHILVQAMLDFPGRPDVYRVNVKNGKQRRIVKEQKKIRDWVADRQGVVRVGRARDYDTEEVVFWYRDNSKQQFKKLFEYNNLNDKPMSVLGFGLNPMEMYYTKYNGNFKALYKMDMKSRESTLLLSHEKYDVGSSLITSTVSNEVIGLYDSHSPYGRYYFDEKHHEFLDSLDKVLPDDFNQVISTSADENTYIVYSSSDNKPGFYYLGDKTTQQLQGLFGKYPQLEEMPFPKHQKITYKARDGLEIEAYITLPTKGKAPYPTIVHPHGGPNSRDSGGFDYWVAYLVDKGYAVIRPNFRGSSGFGYKFAQAHIGKWGLEMQDDITDAAHYMIDNNYAIKEKMCILGASYGGYAAMMATVKTPDLFACAVSFAGVSDLQRLRRDENKWLGQDNINEAVIGTKRSDLKSRSPITGVDKITTPLLLVHGSDDIIVKAHHSRNMADKLAGKGKAFKYVELERGDHYLSIQANRNLFFAELDRFLEEHLNIVTN